MYKITSFILESVIRFWRGNDFAGQGHTLKSIVDYARRHNTAVRHVRIIRNTATGGGILVVSWADDSFCHTTWKDFAELCLWVRARKSWGQAHVPFTVNGLDYDQEYTNFLCASSGSASRIVLGTWAEDSRNNYSRYNAVAIRQHKYNQLAHWIEQGLYTQGVTEDKDVFLAHLTSEVIGACGVGLGYIGKNNDVADNAVEKYYAARESRTYEYKPGSNPLGLTWADKFFGEQLGFRPEFIRTLSMLHRSNSAREIIAQLRAGKLNTW